MQEGGQRLGVWAYVTSRNLIGSGTMNCLFTMRAPVVMVAEAGNFGLGNYYIFLIVVGVFLTRGYVPR